MSREPSPAALAAQRLLRHGGVVARRARYVGRGWPPKVIIEGRLKVSGSGVITLGEGVRLDNDVWLHAEAGAHLSIGPRSAIGRGSQISAMGEVSLGEDVLLSPYAIVMDHTHGVPDDPRPYLAQPLVQRGGIRIGDGSWIGAHACVLSGQEDLVVGRGSLLGAGAVVTRSVDPGSVVVGPTARPRAAASVGSVR